MTRRTVRELADKVRPRYLRAPKKKKTLILDEFVANTGMHRKAAIRLLNRGTRPGQKRSGRPKVYGASVAAALRVAWEATDQLCSKRLQPFLPELLEILQRKKEIEITDETRLKLCAMSPSSMDRVLRRWRSNRPRRGFSTTKPGTLLKGAIPVRTFSEWDDKRPGFIEVDLVAHCGESTDGFYLNTLSAVDVATGWYEPVAVHGKAQHDVKSAVHAVRQRLPVPLLGLDSDNGSEFINRGLYEYCQGNNITFTRSRSYKKNDSCFVEQKNWAVVRKTIGYHRFSSREAYGLLQNIYVALRLYVNFFQPVRKLLAKTRHGARVHKVYDTAQTPYRRMLHSGMMSPDKERQLAAIYEALNPVDLIRKIRDECQHLWTMADPSGG